MNDHPKLLHSPMPALVTRLMPFKVLTAEMCHETNSFSLQETDEQAFRNRYVLMGAEAISERGNANTELAGFLESQGIPTVPTRIHDPRIPEFLRARPARPSP